MGDNETCVDRAEAIATYAYKAPDRARLVEYVRLELDAETERLRKALRELYDGALEDRMPGVDLVAWHHKYGDLLDV